MLSLMELEPILADNPHRFCMFPIKYKAVWEMYKKAIASFWTVEEVDLSSDYKHWEGLTNNERHFMSHVLDFFAASDSIVLENLAIHFMKEVQILEARAFYDFQIAIENIHSELYNLLLETYIKGQTEKAKLFNAIESIPCVTKKVEWVLHWIERLMTKKLHESRIKDIVYDAVNIEREFVYEALSCDLVGMNANLMSDYIEFVVNHLLIALGYSKMFNTSNPFDWMELISLQGKTNFFEKRVGEYQKSLVMANLEKSESQHVFKNDEDF